MINDLVGTFIIPLFFNFIVKYKDEIKYIFYIRSIFLNQLDKKNIQSFVIDTNLLIKILYNIRIFRGALKKYPALFKSKHSKHQLRFDVFSENKTASSLYANNIHKIILMQSKKEFILFTFLDEKEYLQHIKVMKLLCYFISDCTYLALSDPHAQDMLYNFVASQQFLKITHTYLAEFIRTIDFNGLFALFINLLPYISSKTLSTQIHTWSELLLLEIQKKEYSFKDLLGYTISGNKLLMQALVKHPRFDSIVCDSTDRSEFTYSAIREVVEEFVYPKKHHPYNIMQLYYQSRFMTHNTIHLRKHVRKV